MNILERLRQEFPGENIELLEEVDPQGKHTAKRTLIVNGKTVIINSSNNEDNNGIQLLHEVMREDSMYDTIRNEVRILLRG